MGQEQTCSGFQSGLSQAVWQRDLNCDCPGDTNDTALAIHISGAPPLTAN